MSLEQIYWAKSSVRPSKLYVKVKKEVYVMYLKVMFNFL